MRVYVYTSDSPKESYTKNAQKSYLIGPGGAMKVIGGYLGELMGRTQRMCRKLKIQDAARMSHRARTQ